MDTKINNVIIQWMEHEAPLNGWTTVNFPISFTTKWIICDSVCNTYTYSDAATSTGPYTINTGRSTNSYFLFLISNPNSWYHINAIIIGY